MATPPPDPTRDALFLAYFDLYCRYRGLMALLVRRGLVPPERFEDDVEMWIRENRGTLLREAVRRYARYVLQLAFDPNPDPPRPDP